MSWTIERRGRVAVVAMTTNPVNAQNRAFFADLQAFDVLGVIMQVAHRADRYGHAVLCRPGSAGAFPAVRQGSGGGGVVVPGLSGDEHAVVHVSAPDGGGSERGTPSLEV